VKGKAKKDVPVAVVSDAACVSRAPPDDASRPDWARPAWFLRVHLLSTIFAFVLSLYSKTQHNHWTKRTRYIRNSDFS